MGMAPSLHLSVSMGVLLFAFSGRDKEREGEWLAGVHKGQHRVRFLS